MLLRNCRCEGEKLLQFLVLILLDRRLILCREESRVMKRLTCLLLIELQSCRMSLLLLLLVVESC